MISLSIKDLILSPVRVFSVGPTLATIRFACKKKNASWCVLFLLFNSVEEEKIVGDSTMHQSQSLGFISCLFCLRKSSLLNCLV